MCNVQKHLAILTATKKIHLTPPNIYLIYAKHKRQIGFTISITATIAAGDIPQRCSVPLLIFEEKKNI